MKKVKYIRISSLILCIILLAGCKPTPKNVSSSSKSQISNQISIDNASKNEISKAFSSASSSIKNSSIKPVSGIKNSNIISSSSSSVDNSDKYIPNTYAPLGNNIMPIGAWVSPPPANTVNNNPNYITNENFKSIKESGINIIYGLYENASTNLSAVLNALDYAQNNGIKYLVRDSATMTGIDDPDAMNSSLNRYKNKPAFLGNLVVDEPSTPVMEGLGDCHKNYIASAPNSVFYINLLPTYASVNQLFKNNSDSAGGDASDSDYNRYLDTFINSVNPKFISYDYYSMWGSFPAITNNYFKNMSFVRSACLKSNIPFWVFIQSCSYGQGIRIPTKAETFWQVNTALAYGAKGIQYFCYWTPLESESFQGAMVTKTGEKTQVYYDVKEMNKQITAVDEVLMNSNSKGVIVQNGSPAAIPSSDRINSYKELISVSGSMSVLVGCFNHKGKAAYYVVNNTITQNGNATLNFNKTINYTIVSKGSQSTKSGNSLNVSLTAGEGILVYVN